MPDQAVILLAEDREDDILLVRRAFAKAGVKNPLYVVRDGEETISYLAGDGKYSNRAEFPLPHLLLLDLKMPSVDGFEVLRWARQQPGLSNLRILVLTSSEDLQDVNRAYALGANSFLVKQMDFENAIELSRTLHTYWLRLSQTSDSSRPPRDVPTKAAIVPSDFPPGVRE